MSRFLSWYDLDVTQAAQISQAQEQCQRHEFDAFICSLSFEPREVMRFLGQIRSAKKGSLSNIPIIALYVEEPTLEDYRKYRTLNIYLHPQYSSPEKWFEKIQTLFQEKTVS